MRGACTATLASVAQRGGPRGHKKGGMNSMIRPVIAGTLIAAVLLSGAATAGVVDQAQAQIDDCRALFGSSAGCGELYFNMSPDPRDPQPTIQLASPPLAASAASQAAPAPGQQPGGHEEAQRAIVQLVSEADAAPTSGIRPNAVSPS